MITFICALLLLVGGYFTYGTFIAKFFGVDANRQTPVQKYHDGVDFIPMKTWRLLLIQLLNITGLGPIFGAILGAMYGTAAYLWIIFGCIFMGAVHDFFSGFASLRHDGMSLPNLIGYYLGVWPRRIMTIFSCAVLLCVGVLFTKGPADLLKNLSDSLIKETATEQVAGTAGTAEIGVPAEGVPANSEISEIKNPVPAEIVPAAENTWRSRLLSWNSAAFWAVLILAYYLASTIFPIDTLIGKIYPIFAAAFFFMALGVGGALLWKGFAGTVVLPEFSLETFKNMHADPVHNLLFPMLFVTISCGALSGFHATQSPMMARCMVSEKLAQPVFYGSMILEGIIAMIWATAAIVYTGGVEALNNAGVPAAVLVNNICHDWLGLAGAVVAVIGVVICPVTSGDTALRAMRLIIADALRFSQKKFWNRFAISFPLVAFSGLACMGDFSVIWRYLGISNQLLASLTLWTATAYLVVHKKPHWITSVPAFFMTTVCASYFVLAQPKEGGLGIELPWLGYAIGLLVAGTLFALTLHHAKKSVPENEADSVDSADSVD